MRHWIAALTFMIGCPSLAASPDLTEIVDGHVLSGYRLLSEESADLAEAAREDCQPSSEALRGAYHEAFDAWVSVSHLRFGPSEQDDRAFALAFWPDPRGSTPKALGTFLRDEDAVVARPEDFRTVSIAARGFYALEFLLYDAQFLDAENVEYRCQMIRAVTEDIASNAAAILEGWETGYAELMRSPGNQTYRSETEAAQQFFTALSTGLQFTSEARLGRPLGTYERPRPNRAEARRSERALRHVVLSLQGTRDLADKLSDGDAALLDAFDNAIARARNLDDPIFAGVSDPQTRFRVEVLQQNVDLIRRILSESLGPKLGVAAGFNSLDGD